MISLLIIKRKRLLLFHLVFLIFFIGGVVLLYYINFSKKIEIPIIDASYSGNIIPQEKILFNLESPKITNIWGQENINFKNQNTLHITYPRGSINPAGSIRGGAGFIYHIETPSNHMQLTYTLEFGKNFDFVKGGKLPGFCGGTCPRGGSDNSEGFSTRFMWRAKGDFELYGYFPSDDTVYGKSIGRGMYRFEAGKKYSISQELILNDEDKKNGEIIVYVNGNEVFREIGYTFRGNDEIQIDRILFSTFFGGSDESWATPATTNITFSDFIVEKL